MALEDNIQQDSFPNEREKVLVNILYTHGHLVNALNKQLKLYNITRQQYNVLRILRGQYPKTISVANVKERMIEKMSDASRIVDRLKIKELISKSTHTKDKRQSAISINSKGLKLLDELDLIITNFELEHIQLNLADSKTLNRLMDKIRGE
jgi:DNA-binding MarR family transcriptional regulator